MDPQTLWLIALSVATPVAGVVGFAIQLRQVKKTRLENEKLQLERAALKVSAAISERRIMQVTTTEVQRFGSGDVMFSLDLRDNEQPYKKLRREVLKEEAVNAAIVLVVLVLFSYFIYDLYRMGVWLAAKL
jgi:multidrug resistance efflux pump